MKSGRPYSLVTKYWPRIAAGLVVVIGLVEFVVGGLTADSGLEFYLLAWAGTTGGLWFLFEKAEEALADESRVRVAEWFKEKDPGAGIAAVPQHFSTLFDQVFGERHLSWSCFGRSVLATYATAGLTAVVLTVRWEAPPWIEDPKSFVLGMHFPVGSPSAFISGAVLGPLLSGLLPSYLSLLQTRLKLSRP